MNDKRFKKDDDGMPGAGTYNLPSSVVVKQPRHQTSVFKSVEPKVQDLAVNRDFPSAAEYDTDKYKSIAHKEFQGGASNNFLMLTQAQP